MKVLYFTGTGNSLSVAKHFGKELISIPQMIKNNTYLIEDDIVGLILPTYFLGVPPIVKSYLKRCKIQANYTFVITTYGCYAGGSLSEIKRVLKSNGNKADYYAKLLMVDNFLPFFDMNSQLALVKKKNITYNLDKIIFDINSKKIQDAGTNVFNKILSLLSCIFISGFEKHISKLFYINKACIGCGVCKTVCPTNNIELVTNEGLPTYGNNCSACLSCIHNCPQNAIQMRVQRSKARFRNPEVLLDEIEQSND